ncbi:GntR family transcriptional regulator [Actinomycetospora straminea]|uniref:GntR family transcriptional regulator n=2 Tax=Actinomycetospora straminea TaxID=663607 RepID=A0ABP9EHL2_9PSEU
MPAEVETYVRGLILSGELGAGRLVSIDRLAEDLDMSPTPIREGLLALRAQGFLALEPRRGFRVVELRPSDIADMFDAQAYLAGELASRAAARIPAEEVDRLEAVQDRLESAAAEGRTELVEDLNHEFHRTINKAAGSPKLTLLLAVAVRYVPRHFFASIEGYVDTSVADHRAILAALRAGAVEDARARMREHIDHGGALVRANLVRRAAEDAG